MTTKNTPATPLQLNIGQYRVTFTLHGPFAEVWVAESARCHGHWRLVQGKKRAEVLAIAQREIQKDRAELAERCAQSFGL